MGLFVKPVRKPAVKVVDTTGMSREDWLEQRKKGIGGSDLATIMGVNPWGTLRDLYYTKRGIKGAVSTSDNDGNWVAMEVGNLLEPLVAKIFAHKTGFKPVEDKILYAHPDHPFMFANLDFRFEIEHDWTAPDGTVFPAGTKALLECKTTNYHAKEKWEGGTIPVNYEYQMRHYMAVMDVDVCFIACLSGNSEGDFVWRYLIRDLDIEADIVAMETDFWQNNVLAGVEPSYTESSDLVLESLRKHLGQPDKGQPDITLDSGWADTITEYEHLKTKKADAEKKVAALKEEMKQIQALLIEEMGTSCKAACVIDDDEEYIITNNPVYKDTVYKDGLKANHPLIFEQYVKKEFSRANFGIKKMEKKKKVS